MADERLVLQARRGSDLLVVDFECVNLRLVAGNRLERSDREKPAFIIVHFPAQHLAERAFVVNAAGQGVSDRPPVQSAIAGGSRLAFQLPDRVESIPATLEALLLWDEWIPRLVAAALPRSYDSAEVLPPLATPAADETAIEFPFRLILSPDREGTWRHELVAPQHDGNVELWQTRLVQRNADGTSTLAAEGGDLRAVAVVDRQNPFTTTLSRDERAQMVQLSSSFDIRPRPGGGPLMEGLSEAERQAVAVMLALRFKVPSPYRPQPIAAERFTLSALGVSARLRSRWDFPVLPPEVAQALSLPVLSLQQYEHVAGLGRDQYVKTVRVGFLCGTGHRASLVKTSERRFTNFGTAGSDENGALFGAIAYLHQSYRIVVQEPVMDYRGLNGAYQNEGREMPLRVIRLTTLVTPPIDLPVDPAAIEAHAPGHLDPQQRAVWIQNEIEKRLQSPFWIEVLNRKIMFQALAEDADGNSLSLALPLMFVPHEALGKHNQIRNEFDAGGVQARTLDLNRQTVAVAPSGNRPGSTHLTVNSLTYDIEQPPGTLGNSKFLRTDNLPPRLLVRFLPWIAHIHATSPALEEMTGSAEALPLRLDEAHYLSHGWDAAQSFATLNAPFTLKMGAQRAGGLARPDSRVDAISRTLGPAAAPGALAAGKVDISAFANARLLGAIPLRDLLPADLPFDAQEADGLPDAAQLDNPAFKINAPRLIITRLRDENNAFRAVETRYLWKPQLKETQAFGILTLELASADLLLDARLTRQVASGDSSMRVTGRLRQLGLSFANAVAVQMGELHFRAEEGRKMEVGAKEVTLTFLGPLQFVSTLRRILPADGFDDPPFVNVDTQGISAGYTLGIPSVGVGIFSLQNLALGAVLAVPFADKPAGFRFNISERHKPFLVTVTLFGGGGFFALAVSASGLEQVEAAIEFGGNISLNLGIASGGVFVMAGIYFKLTKTSVELTGYLRCGGYLEVLGLISVSLEFYLAFTWRKKEPTGSEVWGQATLTVSVKVAFFSKSVRLSIERRFAGSDGDPTFAQANSEEDWEAYLLAFGG